MSIDTRVDADPDSCRTTARRLTALGDELAEARSYLGGQAHLSREHFEGHTADAYRERCAGLRRAVDDAAESCRGLARALHEYADGLDDVLAVMARARDVARGELVLHGQTIPSPGDYATDRQRHVYRTVAGFVADARREEARLRHGWLSAIERYAVGPEQTPYAPIGPGGPLPGVPETLRAPWPPPEGQWPGPEPARPGPEPAREPEPSQADPPPATAPAAPATGVAPASLTPALATPSALPPPDSVFVPRGDDDDA